jgi:outer membrane receptor protein involved in Fe transport
MKAYLFILTLFFCSISFAQNAISGTVTSENQPVSGANVKIVGESGGVETSSDGKFTLSTSKSFPITVVVSNVGFQSQKIQVVSSQQKISVKLESTEVKLDEIVISASRTPERVRESPVTIERMTVKDIKKNASATFYDGLENLKEVNMSTSSLTFKSINTRGFATVANTRFMQLVDGMDNASPLLNFVLGNLIGVSEIDVQNVELLPGAASALYGANAFNGILLMNSKSPFTHQGITAYAKFGQTSQKAAGNNEYYDYGIRAAHAFSKHFAAKANFTMLKGTDWYATNYRDLNSNVAGSDRSFYNYNGMNVYGDEAATNLKSVGQTLAGLGLLPAAAVNLLPSYNVSRTGYNETDLTDNKVANAKVDLSFHVRPFGNENLEIIAQSKFGFGNTVYQGANRYYLNGFMMQQHKLEIKGKNFFARTYFTTEDGGHSYDMLFTGININRQWKPDATWFGQYAGAFVQATLGGASTDAAHAAGRATADTGRLLPGTAAFKTAFDKVTNDGSVLTGSKLIDNSYVYHSDVNYNFKDLIDVAEIQVGGSYRVYALNSYGRIYTDALSPINYNEYGAYTQVQKKLMDDRLKFTGSIRYDKAKNFKANYSPRVSLVYSAGENKQHNFRASFQTGFKNPSTQDQYIGFNVGSAILLGSAIDNLDRYTETLPVTTSIGQALAGGTNVTITGKDAYYDSYTAASARAFAASGNAALLKKTNVELIKPEEVKAFELGYRGRVAKIDVDLNGYYNIYNDFQGNLTVVAPLYGTAKDAPAITDPTVHALATGNTRAFQLYTNSAVEIKSIGFGVGLGTKVLKDFDISVNYNYAEFSFDNSIEPDFKAYFNTPKHRVKASFGNEKLFKNFGFNVSSRWNTEYLWQSTFASGLADGIIGAATVIDAQINYTFPSLKSTLKIGASNLGGKEYYQVIGTGAIGQQIYASWTINK